jgi:hypothetical protein
MPLVLLKIKAELENIAELKLVDGFALQLDIENEGSERKTVTVSSTDVEELEGSRGDANFVVRWGKGAPQAYVKIVPVKKCDGTYKAENSGQLVTLLGLECRGLTVTKWHVGAGDFDATSVGGTNFNGIDLTDSDWADYDDQNGNDMSVSVTAFECKVESG